MVDFMPFKISFHSKTPRGFDFVVLKILLEAPRYLNLIEKLFESKN